MAAGDDDDEKRVEERLLQASLDAVKFATFGAKWLKKTIVDSGSALIESNERLSWDSADAIAQGFRGRQLNIEVGGRPLTAILRAIELRPDGERGARLELSHVSLDGVIVPRVSVIAAEVSFEAPPDFALLLTGVEVSGQVGVDELVGWADRQTPDWSLELLPDGRISALGAKDDRRVIAVPVVVGRTLELELRHLAWRGVGIDLPSWLKMTHRIPLPPLPEGVLVLDAAREDDAVAFRLAVSDVRRKIDLRAALIGASRPPTGGSRPPAGGPRPPADGSRPPG